jgi:SulP family sulfate permease
VGDFIVILAVIVVAKAVSLIAASAVGIGLAILLFLREQIGGSAVRRLAYGNQVFSKRSRVPEAAALLHEEGKRTAIFELQGSLFFGTTDQLYTRLEPEAKVRDFLILDLRRVQGVDATAVHVLEMINDLTAEHGGLMILCSLPRKLSLGKDVQDYFKKAGLVAEGHKNRVLDDLDAALEWVEDRILEEVGFQQADEHPLGLEDIVPFRGRKHETLDEVDALMVKRSYQAGERIFAAGDVGDELFLVRRGAVRIVLRMGDGGQYRVATIGQGNCFGEMAFLDAEPRSADAVAEVDTDLFILTRAAFESFASQHKKLAIGLMAGLASTIACHLRYADAELRSAREA